MREASWIQFVCASSIVIATSSFALAEIRQPVDFFVMQAVHRANIADAVLTSPKLRGIHLRDEWALVQPTVDNYSFTWLDEQVARAKRFSKQVTLGVYTGVNSPEWLNVPLVDGVPIPWDPRVMAAHTSMVARLGAQYADEPAIAAVHISASATNRSMEMHYPPGLEGRADYSDDKVIESWKSAIDAYAAAFPDNALVLDVAMVPNSRGAVTFAVIDYARKTLGPRANFIHCSLKASTLVDAPHHSTIVNLARDGARIGFEMVSPSIDVDRFGGPFSQALALGEQAGASWYQVYQADVPLIPDELIGLSGDYNRDGLVDAADYVLWRRTLDQVGAGLAADGNGNGAIDTGDYTVWRSQFGQSTGLGAVAFPVHSLSTVPEPASALLLTLWAAVETGRSRRIARTYHDRASH